MGTDIYGWVEGRREGEWSAEFRVGQFLHRSYDMFGCLFGVRNHANFEPLFANRGLPEDLSEVAGESLRTSYDAENTWASFKELAAIDPEETSTQADRRIHELEILDDGTERLVGKALFSIEVAEYRDEIEEKGEVRVGNRIYRKSYVTRGEALAGSGFEELMEAMKALAKELGGENVRLVVGFG